MINFKILILVFSLLIFNKCDSPRSRNNPLDPNFTSERILMVPNQFNTIQEAIHNAFDGDTIFITQDVIGSGNRDITFEGKSLVITGQIPYNKGGLRPKINCNFQGRGFYLDNSNIGDSIVIESLVIENGFNIGGGIYIDGNGFKDTQKLKINNVLINQCVSPQAGGGLYITNFPNIEHQFSNLTIESCQSNTQGGGIEIFNEFGKNITINFCNLDLTNNTSVDAGGGLSGRGSSIITINGLRCHNNRVEGGQYFSEGGCMSVTNIILKNAEIHNNFSQSGGGGIYANANFVDLNNVNISNNASDGAGGGLYLSGEIDSLIAINQVALEGNTALGNGGGLYISATEDDVSINVSNVILYDNVANDRGGGMYIQSAYGAWGKIADILIENVTLSSNTSNQLGGGICVRDMNVLLKNAIIWNNIPESIAFFEGYSFTSNLTISYSDIEGAITGIIPNQNEVINLEGNISLDPLLIFDHYLGGSGLWGILDSLSPCINAGNPDPQFNDYDGSRNDMGGFGGPLSNYYPLSINTNINCD